ncbi:hypothetical protein YWIDRAFT_08208 [Streptomyces sp. SceaMP-e96]|nr:hypothetical protein YWIDRAFT_08208 [Streptomyces sp. SceaMP-e96]
MVPRIRGTTVWHLKQNAASNSARSREFPYARTLQPGEKPQRCCSLPGRFSIKARVSAASFPAQWATALPGYAAPRLAGRAEILTTISTGTGAPIRLDGEFTRDEADQATYLRELVEIFDTNGVDSAFAFLFALDNFPHRPDGDPRDDLDLASPGIVKVLDNHLGDTYPDIPWEPKTAFTALADSYRA